MGSRLLVVLLLGGALAAPQTARAGGADDHGAKVHTFGRNGSWKQVVGDAHVKHPKLTIYWPHPTRTKNGIDFVGNYEAEGSFDTWGPTADSYRCADSIKSYGVLYHTPEYSASDFKPPPSFSISVNNSTGGVCSWLFDRLSTTSPYTENVFTKTATQTIALSRVVKGRRVAYKVDAAVYTDTATGDLAGLNDCILVLKIGSTFVSILANHSDTTSPVSASCSKAAEFAARLHPLRFAKG